MRPWTMNSYDDVSPVFAKKKTICTGSNISKHIHTMVSERKCTLAPITQKTTHDKDKTWHGQPTTEHRNSQQQKREENKNRT